MDEGRSPAEGMSIGIVIGVAIGAGLGASMDNMGAGMGIGIAIGVALGAALGMEEEDDHPGTTEGGSEPDVTDADGDDRESA